MNSNPPLQDLYGFHITGLESLPTISLLHLHTASSWVGTFSILIAFRTIIFQVTHLWMATNEQVFSQFIFCIYQLLNVLRFPGFFLANEYMKIMGRQGLSPTAEVDSNKVAELQNLVARGELGVDDLAAAMEIYEVERSCSLSEI